jgi:hypothetical protein
VPSPGYKKQSNFEMKKLILPTAMAVALGRRENANLALDRRSPADHPGDSLPALS